LVARPIYRARVVTGAGPGTTPAGDTTAASPGFDAVPGRWIPPAAQAAKVRGDALTWVRLQARDEFVHDFRSGLSLFGECNALSGPQ
jgi:hypothetical protein